jgi:hypothetical protein
MNDVKYRSSIAAALVVALVTASAPRRAHAQEAPEPPVATVMPLDLAPITPPLDFLAVNPARAALAGTALAPSPSDIRLSRGAKTAIIVGAIVVGVLLLVGVVVVVGKHKAPGP